MERPELPSALFGYNRSLLPSLYATAEDCSHVLCIGSLQRSSLCYRGISSRDALTGSSWKATKQREMPALTVSVQSRKSTQDSAKGRQTMMMWLDPKQRSWGSKFPDQWASGFQVLRNPTLNKMACHNERHLTFRQMHRAFRGEFTFQGMVFNLTTTIFIPYHCTSLMLNISYQISFPQQLGKMCWWKGNVMNNQHKNCTGSTTAAMKCHRLQ